MNTHDEQVAAAGQRQPRVWPIVAMVIVLGASPLYGVIFQMWPDWFPGDGGSQAGRGQQQAQQARQSSVAMPASAPAPVPGTGLAAPAPEQIRRSTDFMPKDPEWSRILTASPDAAGGAGGRGQTIASAGNGAGAAPCISCHTVSTPAPAGTLFPSLAGLSAEYLAKQLVDYRSGSRNDPVMGPIAKALKDEDIAAVARYYAGQPAPAVTLVTTAPSGRAGTLHAIGDNARGLPACANCHGGAGEGQGPLLPRLSGQPADYLVKQLAAFRGGTRSNDGDAVMRAAAQRLTEDDARALGTFYAGGGR
ncbi:c-type cytochrome [Cupriavidus respiraculi]|uniref:Cytochrome c domain-containing protein n=1 Tax=Cupriavidus respiraculi TaxID=195930 RepID=A0ABN7Y7U9_9BURK|nr:c-type cytochrome [Cupriavidus respiraculi]CAG9167877.1 hypothetical protein LMG21510_00885 [Cupriavidus respiraculi]